MPRWKPTYANWSRERPAPTPAPATSNRSNRCRGRKPESSSAGSCRSWPDPSGCSGAAERLCAPVLTDVPRSPRSQEGKEVRDVRKFWHIGINVTDMDASIKFYTTVGFEVLQDKEINDANLARAFM